MTGDVLGWAIPLPRSNIGARLRNAMDTAAHAVAHWRLPARRPREPYYPGHRLPMFEEAAMQREMYRL